MTAGAAWTFVVLAVFVALFQVALVAGAPWGHLTMGGRVSGRLPAPMRGVAAFSGLLLVAFAAVVATRAGVVATVDVLATRWFVWVVVGYSALGAVANAETPSAAERALWVPVVVLMLASSLVVALST